MLPTLAASRLLSRFAMLVVLIGTVAVNAEPAVAQDKAGSSSDLSPVPSPPPPQPASLEDNDDTAEDAREPSETEYEVLLQGPVHEAFAAPVDDDLTDGVRVYSKAPPEPIDEQPPENESSDDAATWIPGYWAWSDDADQYVWVSGLYRQVPPGRTWIEGYWSKQDSGYRWTSGYWAPAEASHDQVRYLPVPPKSIDNGPSTPPPADDCFWLPGQWNYVDDHYQWRSGFWTKHYEDWVWQPDCYVYTLIPQRGAAS